MKTKTHEQLEPLHTSFLMWLNQQTYAEDEEWILERFLFVLKKIALHEQIRLDDNHNIHRRFWKGMEKAFCSHHLTKSTKPRDVFYYQFIERVLLDNHWIDKDEQRVYITKAGRRFLRQPRKQQWNNILQYIWP
ncbi:hypothetical protein SAMN05192534_101577 [Alteribacillus persepolensis]|uniref:Uncharacterized protein n=1 Tax=Alteribacillus persepolensis TaxID=568899 RepID=A0A1G7ZLM3_9BACI|nr:hypothetical protein [Alteribacillus persepolensis]SDH09000.1 hypothetical protein SAMN05192534_101577 [Alteribacillus persepolensis]